MSVSLYWKNHGKTEADITPGATFERSDGLGCAECCTKLRETDCNCWHRDSCPYCLGTSLNANCFDANGKRIKRTAPVNGAVSEPQPTAEANTK